MKAIYNENLNTALSFFLRDSRVISITGAGGKTSLLIRLGDLFTSKDEKVLLTTTTHLATDVDYGNADFFALKESEKRFTNPGIDKIKAKLPEYDRVIIEADGSKRLPLKYHREKDPVVIDETDTVLAVMGLSSLGKPLSTVLFGIDEYRKETERNDEIATLSTLESLINALGGALKSTSGKKTFVVLNQADVLLPEDVEKVNALMFRLKKNYMLVSLRENKLYAGLVF